MYNQSTEMVLTDDDGETYEECTYTYCGDRSKRDLEFAEQFLQHSGIANGTPPPQAPQPLNLNGNSDRGQNALRLFSPDLDFLEMDFDPGVSVEAEEQAPPAVEEIREGMELVLVSDTNMPSTSTSGKLVEWTSQPESSCSIQPVITVEPFEEANVDVVDSVDLNSNIVRNCFADPNPYMRRRGSDPVCHRGRPKSLVKYASADHPFETLKKPVLSVDRPDEVMIWSEADVEVESKKSVGGSGVAAITLALRAFGWSHVSHQVVSSLRARSRKMALSVPQYLRACSEGEFNQKDIALAVADISDGSLTSSFVELDESNVDSVREWLPGLMRSGQIPILTFPVQPGAPGSSEGWAHRVINRVNKEGLEIIPPVMTVSHDDLRTFASESPCVLVPGIEVYESWGTDDDVANLRVISEFDDVRWRDWNVLGQVCHLLRNGPCSIQNILLPSEFRFGITFVSLIEKL